MLECVSSGKQARGWSSFLSEFSNNNIILPTAQAKHKICFSTHSDAKTKAEAAEMYTNHIKDNGNKYLYLIQPETQAKAPQGRELNIIIIIVIKL